MSDNNTKQKPQAPQQKQVKKSGSSGGRFFIGLITLLALLLAGAASGLGYYAWLELNKRLDQAGVDRQSIVGFVEHP